MKISNYGRPRKSNKLHYCAQKVAWPTSLREPKEICVLRAGMEEERGRKPGNKCGRDTCGCIRAAEGRIILWKSQETFARVSISRGQKSRNRRKYLMIIIYQNPNGVVSTRTQWREISFLGKHPRGCLSEISSSFCIAAFVSLSREIRKRQSKPMRTKANVYNARTSRRNTFAHVWWSPLKWRVPEISRFASEQCIFDCILVGWIVATSVDEITGGETVLAALELALEESNWSLFLNCLKIGSLYICTAKDRCWFIQFLFLEMLAKL